MKIAIRDRADGSTRWRKVEDRRYRDEAHLQQLLYESPDLIPLDELGGQNVAPRLFIKEAGLPGSGSSDLIGVDEIGGITVVECKLASNPEIRRTVVAQVLEYAAFLWRMSYDDFDTIVEKREKASLAELMGKRLTETGDVPDWDEEAFRRATAETLQRGSFALIIAVDEVTAELRRTIEYLNSGPLGFSLHALELEYFADERTEMLVPQLVGRKSEGRDRPAAERGQWDRERFLAATKAGNSQDVVKRMETLLEFAEREADRVWWGTGKSTGSFTFHLLKGETWVSVFSVYTDGKLQFNLGWAQDQVSRVLLEGWVTQLRKIRGFESIPENWLGKWPTFPLAKVLQSPEDLSRFQSAVLDFKASVAGSN
jgi:hypothetical protein